MKSRETLESYLAGLAFYYLTIPSCQNEINCAGIDFSSLAGSGFLGAGVIMEYLDHCSIKTHDLVLTEMQTAISFLERTMDRSMIIPTDADIIREKFTILNDAFEIDEFVEKIKSAPDIETKKNLFETMKRASIRAIEAASAPELVSAFLPKMFNEAKAGEAIREIKGFEKLSHMIGGFNKKRMAIIMAETGFGKTNLALNLALSAADTFSVGYVNMEMGFEDMLRRIVVIGTNTSYHDFHRGNYDLSQVGSKVSELGEKFTLTNGKSLSLNGICSWATLMKEKKKIEFLFIDYDQKFDFENQRDEEWRLLQKALLTVEELAKELEIYVVVLAQMNRQNQISGSYRAQFGAHTVLQFSSDEEFGPVIRAVKNRHGKRNQVLRVEYDEHTSRIREMFLIDQAHSQPKLNFEKPKQIRNYAEGL